MPRSLLNIATILMLMLPGCAHFPPKQSADAFLEAGVKHVTREAIADDPVRAANARKVLGYIDAGLAGVAGDASEIMGIIQQEIPWDELEGTIGQLLEDLLAAIEQEINRQIEGGLVEQEYTLFARKLIGWAYEVTTEIL